MITFETIKTHQTTYSFISGKDLSFTQILDLIGRINRNVVTVSDVGISQFIEAEIEDIILSNTDKDIQTFLESPQNLLSHSFAMYRRITGVIDQAKELHTSEQIPKALFEAQEYSRELFRKKRKIDQAGAWLNQEAIHNSITTVQNADEFIFVAYRLLVDSVDNSINVWDNFIHNLQLVIDERYEPVDLSSDKIAIYDIWALTGMFDRFCDKLRQELSTTFTTDHRMLQLAVEARKKVYSYSGSKKGKLFGDSLDLSELIKRANTVDQLINLFRRLLFRKGRHISNVQNVADYALEEMNSIKMTKDFLKRAYYSVREPYALLMVMNDLMSTLPDGHEKKMLMEEAISKLEDTIKRKKGQIRTAPERSTTNE